jgi:predicted nucleic acid-binding protein
LIAATALHFGRTPVTRSLRDVLAVPGLTLHPTRRFGAAHLRNR